ncbi:MAG: hypothetical protein JXA06_07685 [Bacteroidetes bacterium]|nr:hypothetical protein [Bacteroidota bacterium]
MWEKNEYGYGYGSDQSFSPPAFGFTISGGLEIFIAQSAAVEPIITYSNTRFEAEYSVSGIYVGIGAKYFIY